MNGSEFLMALSVGVALSMDAFAVSVTQGACLEITSAKYPLALGITFGLFQALMPLVGWFVGHSLSTVIAQLDHWVAFILLGGVGVKMVADGLRERRQNRQRQQQGHPCSNGKGGRLLFGNCLAMGLATSIDALAVGVTFGMLNVNIWLIILIIGLITFIISVSGVFIGKRIGCLVNDCVQMIGGAILVLLGVQILISHLIRGI